MAAASAHSRLAARVELSAGSRIGTAYADTRAQDLSFALDLPPLADLRRRLFAFADLEVELRILGGSHQVLVSSGGRRLMSETVACLRADDMPADDVSVPLPTAHARQLITGAGELEYRMTSRLADMAGRRDAIAALMIELDRSPTSLLGVFPGHPQAFTGLRVSAQPDGVRWLTWHAYPQTDELVLTSTRLEGGRK